MRWLVSVSILLCLTATSALAAGDPLDALLEQVREARLLQKERDSSREQRFLQQHSEQKRLLEEARAELEREKERQQQLELAYQENHTQLEAQRAQLKEKTGTLGELFGSVRQVASESQTIFAESMISVARPDDLKLLDELANSRHLPSIDKLEGLWQLFLERIVESGRIKRFETPVITSQGVERQEKVTRVGPFNAVSDGRYLRYLPDSGKLVELGRQPVPRFQIMAKQLEQADQELVRMAVDPSRGAILSLLVQSPTLLERIRQGGVIGYIIIGLGVLGLLVVILRLVMLLFIGGRVKRQLKSDEITQNNPLGRMLAVAGSELRLNAEALQLRLDEVIMKELPGLRRGLRMVGIFAAVAPLLGLLGTVTGMIETFQSITLFGTGDPRLMSGGISQALVTTELGLVVAIPLVLLHSFLSGRSNQLIQVLDQQSAALVAKRAEP